MIHNLAQIIEHLGSSKLKWRNEALDSAQYYLDYNGSLSSFQTKNLVNAIVGSVTVDCRGSKKSTASSESRAVLGIKVLRKIVNLKREKCPKSVINILYDLILNLYRDDHQVHESVQLEFAKLLSQITSICTNVLSLEDKQFLQITSFTISLFNKRQTIDNISNQLLEVLHNCIVAPTLSSPRICSVTESFIQQLAECLFHFASKVERASSQASYFLDLANFIIINYSFGSTGVCYRICVSTLKAVSKFQLYNLNNLKSSLLVFSILASDLFSLRYKLCSDTDPELKEVLCEVILMINNEFIDTSGGDDSLKFCYIDFYDDFVTHDISHWFKLTFIFLRSQNLSRSADIDPDQISWMSRLAFTKLLLLYYDLNDLHSQTEDSSSVEPILKRRKIENSFFSNRNSENSAYSQVFISDVLNHSGNLVKFLENLIVADKIVLACQIIIFQLSLDGNNVNFLKDYLKIISSLQPRFSDEKISGWIALCLKIVIDNFSLVNESISDSHAENLSSWLKVSLQSINHREYGDIFCSLSMSIFRLSELHKSLMLSLRSNSALKQQVNLIIDLAEYKGPYLLSNHALIFWVRLHEFFGDIHKIGQDFNEKVFLWLITRAKDLESAFTTNNYTIIGMFLCWISGGKSLKIHPDQLYGAYGDNYIFGAYSRTFMDPCILWYETKKYRNRLEGINKEITADAFIKAQSLVYTSGSNELLQKFLEECSVVSDALVAECQSTTITESILMKKLNILTCITLNLADYSQISNSLEYRLTSMLEKCLSTSHIDCVTRNMSLIENYSSQVCDVDRRSLYQKLISVQSVVTDAFRNLNWAKNEETQIPSNFQPTLSVAKNEFSQLEAFDAFGLVKVSSKGKKANSTCGNLSLYSKYNYESATAVLIRFYLSLTVTKNEVSLQESNFIFEIIGPVSDSIDCFNSFFQIFVKNYDKISSLNKKFLRIWCEKLFALNEQVPNEIAVCFVCKLLSLFADEFMLYEQDFHDVLSYIQQISEAQFLKTSNCVLEIQKLWLRVIPVAYSSKDSKLVAPLIKVRFDELSTIAISMEVNSLKLMLGENFWIYFNTLSPQVASHTYRVVYSAFKYPQQSMETFFTFTTFLAAMVRSSTSGTGYYLFNVLEFIEYEKFHSMISFGISYIAESQGLPTKKLLFEKYRLELFNHWYSITNQNILDFPFSQFDYDSQDEFCLDNLSYLFPLVYVSKNKRDREETIDSLLQIKKATIKELVEEHYPSIIAFSYTRTGWRNEVFSALEKVLGKEDSVYQTQWLSFTVLNVLQLVDISNEKSMATFKQDSSPHFESSLSGFGSIDSRKFCISAGTGKRLIQELIKNTLHRKTFWDTGTTYFLLSSLLTSFNDLEVQEKIIESRRVLIVLLLANENVLSSPDILKLLIDGLFVSSLDSGEISVLVTDILNSSEATRYESFMPSGIAIAAELVRFRYLEKSNERLNSWFEKFIKSLKYCSPIESVVFRKCHEYLIKNKWNLSSSNLENIIIELSSKSGYEIALEKLLVSCFEIGLTESSTPELKPKLAVAEFLLRSDSINSLPRGFQVWKAKYLGCFYYTCGHNLNIPTPGKTLHNVEVAFSKKKVGLIMSLVFSEIRQWMSSDRRTLTLEKRIVENVTGALLKCYKLDPKPIDDICDINVIFKPFINHLTLVNVSILEKLYCSNKSTDCDFGSSDISDISDHFVTDFDNYCSVVSQSMLSELSHKGSYLRVLKTLVKAIPSLSPRLFSYIFLFYIDNISSSIFASIKLLINEWFKLDTSTLSQTAKHFLLNLSLKIRTGAKSGHRRCSTLFDNFICEASFLLAFELGFWKIALMLYESFIPESPKLYKDKLDMIYNSINAEDIKFSVPMQPTITYAIKSIKENSKAILANNAILETFLSKNGVHGVNAPTVIRSIEESGYPGISKLVGLNFGKSIQNESLDFYKASLNDYYRWAWKLGDWDLPDTIEPSYDSLIYCSLKAMRKSPNVSDSIFVSALNLRKSSEIFNERYANEVSDYNKTIRLLGVLWGIESTGKSLGDKTGDAGLSQVEKISWMSNKDFYQFEDILIAKKQALRILDSDLKESDEKFKVQLYKITQLFHYGKFAMLNDEPQKALNSIFEIETANQELICQGSDIELKKLKEHANIVSRFAIATTLWNQEESAVPITMLKKLRTDLYKAGESSWMRQMVSSDLVNGLLVQWLHHSKQESASDIMSNYIESFALDKPIESLPHRCKACHIFAQFCDDQLKDSSFDERIARHNKIIANKEIDLAETTKLRTQEASRYAHKLKKQIIFERNQLRTVTEAKNKFIVLAVRYYLHSINLSDEYSHSDVDRFCALWLKFSDIESVSKIIDNICNSKFPTHKFLMWVSQLSSRLSTTDSKFQRTLKKLLINMTMKHPYHTLFIFKSLRLQRRYNSNPDTFMKMRIEASRDLWKKLSAASRTFNDTYLSSVDSFCEAAVELANKEVPKGSRSISLKSSSFSNFWLSDIDKLKIPLPTKKVPIQKNGDYSKCDFIKKVEEIVEISSSGNSRPKIACFTSSNGAIDKILLKGNTDDLRQDAIMEQVFEKVNIMLKNDRESAKRMLKIRTYKVVPLGPQAGLIEFVPNSIAFLDAVGHYHRKYDKLSLRDASNMMKDWMELPTSERIKNYERDIVPKIKPRLREFFFVNFTNPYHWFESRVIYSKGTAVSSMIGYILGLGDRHCNNILLDKTTGDPIHIDLGVAFDQGQLLFVPETVPFRLTRDIVDGFGVSGVEGIFRKSAEHCFRVLRSEKDKIDGILDVLKWDPLYMWTISPLRKKRLQEELEDQSHRHVDDVGFEASRILSVVQEKLLADGLSVEAVVQKLIQEATDVKNLAVLYCGWTPFF